MTSFNQQIDALTERLRNPLPGRASYMEMAPENPGHRVVQEAREYGCREGAVLVLLYPHHGATHVVLTERTATLSNHAGQISLPGGRIDDGEDAIAAARREAWEELRVPPESLTILGCLSELYIPPSNFCLQPVVAAAMRRPDFEPQPDEVALVIETPLNILLDRDNHLKELWLIAGEERRVPYFWFDPHKIWGATAMILNEFLAVWNAKR